MPTAGHYLKLTDQEQLVRTADGITGTRHYIDGKSTATDSLPEIGDAWDSSATTGEQNCFCASITETPHGNHPTNKLYVVGYTSNPGATAGSNSSTAQAMPELLPITGGLSAEAVSIDAPVTTGSGAVAENMAPFLWDDALYGTNKNVSQAMFRTVITGQFKLTRRVATLLLPTWAKYNGAVNLTSFKVGTNNSYAIETVMFNGVEYAEYRNNKGLQRWRIEFNFGVKVIPLSSTTYGGWNHIFDQAHGRFRKVKNRVTNDPLYTLMNFNVLMSTAPDVL